MMMNGVQWLIGGGSQNIPHVTVADVIRQKYNTAPGFFSEEKRND